MKSILIKFPHGLGDAVQFTIVLRHLSRFRPDWDVDVVSQPGVHSAFCGLCRRSYHDVQSPPDERSYDRVFNVRWHEPEEPHDEVPSTRATRCLTEEFGIQPDASLYRYRIDISDVAKRKTAEYLHAISGGRQKRNGRFPVLLLHYQGDTALRDKALTLDAAYGICQAAITEGLVPVILDWDERSPLADQETILRLSGRGSNVQGQESRVEGRSGLSTLDSPLSGDAEVLAALIEQSSMFVGVDGGPLHVAGATTTPTLAVWTRHFPAQCYHLTDNVTHYVPANWREVGLARRAKVAEYFQQNYRLAVYRYLVSDLTAAISPNLPQHSAKKLFRCGDFWIRRDNAEQDLVIVRDVFAQDAYRTQLLPDGDGEEVVVDVGAHIGCFAKLWHKKNPHAKVICVEACPENLEALRANVGEFAEIVHAACTYETGPVALLNAVRPDCASTGGSIVVPRPEMEGRDVGQQVSQYWSDLRQLPKVTLEDLIGRFGFDRISVLKLDCEGSEFSILRNTSLVDKIHVILGEYHGKDAFLKLVEERFVAWNLRMLTDGELGNFRLVSPESRAKS